MKKKKKLLPSAFMWLFIGLLITFVGGYVISENPKMLDNIFNGSLYLIFAIAEIVIAIVLAVRVAKMKKSTAICLYIMYTFLTGLTISSIFVAYELSSIMIVFLITSVLFGIFALIGKFTKIDLTKFWVYLLIGLIAVVLLEVINIFIMNETLDIISCILGIVVFIGYTAYDVKRIVKSSDIEGIEDTSFPIYFAFELYLDFINIFMDLLRLFGNNDN